MLEKHTASPEMQKFFTKLLALKEYVKKEMKIKNDPSFKEVYERLDEIIKSTEEKK